MSDNLSRVLLEFKYMRLLVFLMAIYSSIIFATDVVVKITVVPSLGSFTATNDFLSGQITHEKDGSITGHNIQIKTQRFTTSTDPDNPLFQLRDKHLKRYIKADKYPIAKLKNAVGKDGKGSAILEFMGKQKEIKFKFKKDKNRYISNFKLDLKDWLDEKVSYGSNGIQDIVDVEVYFPIKKSSN